MADLLTYATIPWFVVYFYLFQRTFRVLEAAERKRFISQAGLPPWRRVLAFVPLVLLFFAPTMTLRLALVAWWLLELAIDTRSHHQRLRALGFDPAFRSQLLRVTYLSGVVFLVFATGMVLKAR
jgi:hypothetical protein